MKLISYTIHNETRWGVQNGESVSDIRTPATLLEAIESAVDIAALTSHGNHALRDITYLPPILAPQKIICVGVNYANRNEEYKDGQEAPKYPSLFVRFPNSFTGHDEALICPKVSEQLDYEGEIVLIIGKDGRHIREEDALSHVYGVSIANEGSVRDWIRHGKFNVTQGKNFEQSGAIGPYLLTTSEIDWHKPFHIETHVNGELRQDDTTENMIFPFEKLIAYISTFTNLKAGDMILTGTPTGAGARFTPPKWLKNHDKVTISVSQIGVLSNYIENEG